jgi:hypothetical protein
MPACKENRFYVQSKQTLTAIMVRNLHHTPLCFIYLFIYLHKNKIGINLVVA